jgi:hypothetical protein
MKLKIGRESAVAGTQFKNIFSVMSGSNNIHLFTGSVSFQFAHSLISSLRDPSQFGSFS